MSVVFARAQADQTNLASNTHAVFPLQLIQAITLRLIRALEFLVTLCDRFVSDWENPETCPWWSNDVQISSGPRECDQGGIALLRCLVPRADIRDLQRGGVIVGGIINSVNRSSYTSFCVLVRNLPSRHNAFPSWNGSRGISLNGPLSLIVASIGSGQRIRSAFISPRGCLRYALI